MWPGPSWRGTGCMAVEVYNRNFWLGTVRFGLRAMRRRTCWFDLVWWHGAAAQTEASNQGPRDRLNR